MGLENVILSEVTQTDKCCTFFLSEGSYQSESSDASIETGVTTEARTVKRTCAERLKQAL